MTEAAITARSDGDSMVRLVITGEIDMANAQQIPAATTQALASHPTRVVIDLAGVSFLDASGLSNLLSAHRIAADINAELRVVNATGIPLRVLTLTGLLDFLDPPAATPGVKKLTP